MYGNIHLCELEGWLEWGRLRRKEDGRWEKKKGGSLMAALGWVGLRWGVHSVRWRWERGVHRMEYVYMLIEMKVWLW